jgi:hypothetical protein
MDVMAINFIDFQTIINIKLQLDITARRSPAEVNSKQFLMAEIPSLIST